MESSFDDWNTAFKTAATISWNQKSALEAFPTVFCFQRFTSFQLLNSDDLICPVRRVLLAPESLVNRKIQGSVWWRDLVGREIPLGAQWSVLASSILPLTENLAFKVPLGVNVWVRGEYISEPGPIVINRTGGLIYSLFIRYFNNANEGVFIVWVEENGVQHERRFLLSVFQKYTHWKCFRIQSTNLK